MSKTNDPYSGYVDVTGQEQSHEAAIAALRSWALANDRDPNEAVALCIVKRLHLRSGGEFAGHRWVALVPPSIASGREA